MGCFTFSSVIFAEEIGDFDDPINSGHIHLRWNIKDSTGYVLTKVNGDNLGSSYSAMNNQLEQAAANWRNSKAKVNCFTASFANSNVDLCKASTIFWNQIEGHSLVAVTIPTDTNGVQLTNLEEMRASSQKIKYASIYFNPVPNSSITSHPTKCLHTIVHEMGHVFGMGHVDPYKETCLMNPDMNLLVTPSSYDITVMNSFYP